MIYVAQTSVVLRMHPASSWTQPGHLKTSYSFYSSSLSGSSSLASSFVKFPEDNNFIMENIPGEFRRWNELIPDALALIFKKLSLEELLTVIPSVCKSWERTVTGPYCWQEIDILDWSMYSFPEEVEKMLQLLIGRSNDSLRKLSVFGACEKSILLIANHAESLETLQLQSSLINNSMMKELAPRLSKITYLDLSYCDNIGAEALEMIGNSCKSLTHFSRAVDSMFFRDDEALVIAHTMPLLKQLDISGMFVQTSSIIEILNCCENLELLNVQGCWNVELGEKFLE